MKARLKNRKQKVDFYNQSIKKNQNELEQHGEKPEILYSTHITMNRAVSYEKLDHTQFRIRTYFIFFNVLFMFQLEQKLQFLAIFTQTEKITYTNFSRDCIELCTTVVQNSVLAEYRLPTLLYCRLYSDCTLQYRLPTVLSYSSSLTSIQVIYLNYKTSICTVYHLFVCDCITVTL